MKKLALIFLLLILPLQATLAAVEAYSTHGVEHESALEVVIHLQSDHDHLFNPAQSDDVCDGDHHHCHAHSVSLLSNVMVFETPPSAKDHALERRNIFQSFFSHQIERPKWC
jgi:hypothetical protein